MEIDGQGRDLGKFNYTTSINPDTQEIDFDFDFKDKYDDDTLLFKMKQDQNAPRFDINRNLVYKNTVAVTIDEICYVSSNQKRALKALAITILVIFLITLIILAVVTITIPKKIVNLANL